MEKIKNFFSSIGGYIVAALALVAGVFAFLYTRKQDENTALKAELGLANTHKEVDIIETELKAKAAEREQTTEELAKTEKDLALIEQKRQEIKASKTDEEVEDYWNKK